MVGRVFWEVLNYTGYREVSRQMGSSVLSKVFGCILTDRQKALLSLKCRLCSDGYSLIDAEDGYFFVSTKICLACYQKGLESKSWCFAKPTVWRDSAVILYGFNPAAQECAKNCPDRHICRLFLKRQGYVFEQ